MDDLNALSDEDVRRIKALLQAFESGRLNLRAGGVSKSLPGPQETVLGKTDKVIPAVSGSTPGTGTVSKWRINPITETYTDSTLNVEARNPTASPIPAGAWVSLSRDPYSGEYWAFPAASTATAVHTQTIGDGAATSITVDHGLGTQNVFVVVYQAGAPYEQVFPTVAAITTTAVTLTFATAPTAGQYVVAITPAGGGGSGVNGPGASVDNELVLFDGTSGNSLIGGGWTIPTPGKLTGPSGGGSVVGGPGAGDDLTLVGTTSSTPGSIIPQVTTALTNTTYEVVSIQHLTTGTPAAGMGTSIGLYAEDASGNLDLAASIGATWTTPTHGAETASFFVQLPLAGTPWTPFLVTGAGAIRLPEISTPATPPSGFGYFFLGSTGNPSVINDAGGVIDLTTVGTDTEGSVAAAGSTQGDAAAITVGRCEVTGADGTKGVILPNSAGAEVIVWNSSGSSAVKVYPPSGAALGVLGTNSPNTQGPKSMVIYWRMKSTQWTYVALASSV